MTVEETRTCDLWNSSNCCSVRFRYTTYPESDICSACGEHAVPVCEDCEFKEICDNKHRHDHPKHGHW